MCGFKGCHLSTDVERENGRQEETTDTSAADRNHALKCKGKKRCGTGEKVSAHSFIFITLNAD